ncbi:MAG: hypothetical protein PHV02_03295 [Rhodocyclaceae bacterium]|nr:hypothetical protein [Rhodocyclaceae bacterium]
MMITTIESLAAEMRPFHNDICIAHDIELGRLVGVVECEDDFYYLVHLLGKEKPSYLSAVGHCISIKGKYPDEHYARLDSVFALNRAVPTPEFLIWTED